MSFSNIFDAFLVIEYVKAITSDIVTNNMKPQVVARKMYIAFSLIPKIRSDNRT